MGTVYRRSDSKYLWVGFTDAEGRRRGVSAQTSDRREADRFLEAIERKVRADKLAAGGFGPQTVEAYGKRWVQARKDRDIATWDKDEDRLKHALPDLGHMLMSEVKRVHIRDLVRRLMAGGKLAPRTVRHVYEALRVMFADAMTEEVVERTPCTLLQRLHELPKRIDKDPRWRAKAVFSRGEVEALISDARIPEQRRVRYAVEFLAGLRIGEIATRRWLDYDPAAVPLGRLTISSAYSFDRKKEKPPKNDLPRDVPVHPVLAKMLAEWRLSGWARMFGRHPEEEDLIIPSTRGGICHASGALKRLKDDCALLGFRPRRTHDARRTFVSLGRADGARADVLRWISHGPTQKEIIDVYTTLPWETLSCEISKLNIRPLNGQMLLLQSVEQ